MLKEKQLKREHYLLMIMSSLLSKISVPSELRLTKSEIESGNERGQEEGKDPASLTH